jgi:hypothetical protein
MMVLMVVAEILSSMVLLEDLDVDLLELMQQVDSDVVVKVVALGAAAEAAAGVVVKAGV